MKKQEVIKKIEKEKSNFNALEDLTRNYALDSALAIIRKLDEPEKPIVPQSVADWLEVCKENLAIGLFFAMTPDVLEVNNQSAETIAKAWIYGYEVEKEKLYTVEIPNPHGLGHSILVKDMYGNIFITHVMNSDWRKSKVNQLTEAEIKKDFDWAWQFAKDVKE